MNSLGIRVALALTAATLIGLSLLNIAFARWSQGALQSRQALTLEIEARRVAGLQGTDWAGGAGATHAGEDEGITVAIIDAVGEVRSAGRHTVHSGTVSLPSPSSTGLLTHDGYRHYIVSLPSGTRVIASAPLDQVVDGVLALQSQVWLLLVGIMMVIVFTGLWFLRRIVLAPLARITDAVHRVEEGPVEAMQQHVDRHARGSRDLVRLGRAINRMSARIDGDRSKIATQLEELKGVHENLEAAQEHLVRSERMAVTGQLAAGLAHEVGNPLAILMGYVELLEQGQVAGAAEDPDILARMTRELQRIHTIVRALLDFSRAQDAVKGRGDVSEAIEHVLKLVGPQESMRGVTVETEIASALPAAALSADGLTQILLNLLLNAADAMAASGRVRVSASQVTVNGCAGVVVDVDDSGPGLTPEARQRALEPFYTSKPAGQGTGLGLTVCESVVTSVGGTLSIEDSALGGACFRIWVPEAQAQ